MNAYQLDDFKIFSYPLNEDLALLVCQGAVSVGFFINDCIKNYASGILTDFNNECGCSQLKTTNHAVAIIGFGVDGLNSACKKYWLVKNSWGKDWGENGFMRVCRKDKEMALGTCSIRSEAVLPTKGKVLKQKSSLKTDSDAKSGGDREPGWRHNTLQLSQDAAAAASPQSKETTTI